MKLKTKPLTRNQLTKLVADYELRFEAIADTLESLSMTQPDYSGAITLNAIDGEGKLTRYYMVTKYCIQDPYITFYHLIPPEDTGTFSINSFPDKPDGKSTRSFIRSLEKQKRWNKVFERIFIPSIERMQFVGHFTYTRVMELEDNPAIIIRPDNTILDFKTSEAKDD